MLKQDIEHIKKNKSEIQYYAKVSSGFLGLKSEWIPDINSEGFKSKKELFDGLRVLYSSLDFKAYKKVNGKLTYLGPWAINPSY